jgi:hypothetical protein
MNTQRIALDLSKRMTVKPTVYIGRGDRRGTTVVATVTESGLPLGLGGMTATLALPLGDAPCTTDGDTITCVLGESYVPDGTEHAYFNIIDGERRYSTSRFRIVTLEGAEQ